MKKLGKLSHCCSFRLFLKIWTATLMMIVVLGTSAYAGSGLAFQDGKVSGQVVSSDGTPLPGVTVVIRGTSNGTVTNSDGEFELTNVSSNNVLVFSFIGLKTQEVVVGSQTSFKITMKEETVGVDEVVVVGFGTQKKVNLTGAVGTVQGESMQSRPVQNASQMLQGMVPGLNITQLTGSLEEKPSINIRGTATISEGSTGSPLILIDGMEGDINALNPQDIESISVLKDAAASSIYGSRAPFGVILVTTKKGSAGKMVINYNNNFRWSSPINVPNMMDSYTYALFFNDASVNGGASPHFNVEHLQRIQDYQNGKIKDEIMVNPNNPQYWADGYAYGNANNDWYDVVYKDHSFSQEHNLSFNGGTEKLQYYASANILDQNGLVKLNSDELKRYTTTLKINAQLTDWARLSASNRFIREDFGRPSALNDGLYTDLARQGWPTLPVYDPKGYLYSSPSPALGLRDRGRDSSQKDWLYQQGSIELEPIKDWKIIGEMNYRTINNFRHYDLQQTFNHDVEGNPVIYSSSSGVYEEGSRENYYNINLFTEYTREFEGGHFFKVLLGYQSELNKTRFLSAERDGIIVASLPTLNTTSGTDDKGVAAPPSVAGDYQHWSTEGYFGRINYNYKERYLLEVNMRYDGTSRFRSDKRWNWFPSVSGGWNISKENFWSSISPVIGSMKLRGSYGELGNQNTNSWYPTYLTMPVGTSNGSWLVNGAQPNTSSAPGLVSQSLTWERVKSWNAGIDMGFFNNRLTASFDYFTRYTNDMVGPAPELPVILGTGVPKINNTDLKTYGFELDLMWKDRLQNGLGYSLRVQLSDSQTEITKYPNPTGNIDTYVEGRKLGEIWGYETVGIAKYAGDMERHLASLPNGGQSALGSQWAQGDIMYRDLNNDGKIDGGARTINDHGDLKVIGNNTARFPFSIDLSADWKGFDLRIFMQGVLKRDYYLNSYYFWGAWDWGKWWSTGLTAHEDYYRADPNHPLGQNIDSYYPRPLFNGKNHAAQTGYLQDASYIRLKNLQIGYTLPNELTRNFKVEKLRLYVSGENLWTGTKMSEVFDPETIQGRNYGNNYPLNSVLSLGLSVNF